MLSRTSFPLINFISRRFVQNLPSNVRLEIDPGVNEQLKSKNTKLAYFKEHKGKFHRKSELSRKLEEIINSVISDIEPQRLKNDVKTLEDYLAERRLPIEQSELESIAQKVIHNVVNTEPPINVPAMSPEERQKVQLTRQRELVRRLKSSIYHWQPLTLDEYKSKIYLATNFAAHYAMLVQIFNEIKQREVNFQPCRLFDFGSGAGSVMWAALHVWGKKAFAEILNVDRSRDMNNLSQLILKGGQEQRQPLIPGVIYRQFMPHGRENTFDLVVADHTLFELENQFERLKAVRSMWYTVKPGGFLVLVERGTIHGYSAIMEARDNILNRIAVSNASNEAEAEEENVQSSSTNDESSNDKRHFAAHIFSPCPHHLECPKRQLDTPCRIATRYRPLHLFDVQTHPPSFSTVQMSYIVVKKAERDANDVYGTWPRVIEPILDRRRHQHVRLCCPNGEYVNVTISKNKHGSALHRLSHHAAPGDIFPVNAELVDETPTPDNNEDQTPLIPSPPSEDSSRSRRRAFRT